MKIDFHTHGKLAKNLPFSSLYTKQLLIKAKDAGLDAICLTEHFNTVGYDELIKYFLENYPRKGDSILVEGLTVFIGMEIDVVESGHILVVGLPEEMLQLNQELDPYKTKGNFLSFIQLIAILNNYEIIWGAAHPYRVDSQIARLDYELLKKMDFIDLNGKDYAIHGKFMEDKILDFSKTIGVPILAGSDTHQYFQYGCIYNDFNNTYTSIKELKRAISLGDYRYEIKDDIKIKVEAANILKRTLKVLNATGIDYTSVL